MFGGERSSADHPPSRMGPPVVELIGDRRVATAGGRSVGLFFWPDSSGIGSSM